MNVLSIMITFLLLLSPCVLTAQSVRSHIHSGNDHYKEQKYADAEAEYRKSLEKDNQRIEGYYNLGDALNKQQRFDEAIKNFQTALSKTTDPSTSAQLYHNLGNTYFEQKQLQESIDAYKKALRLNPKDEDTRYNLAYVQKMLKQQQQQKQDQNKQDKNKQNKQKDKQQQEEQKKEEQKKQQQQQNQTQQREKQMSKPEAQRILEALKNDEKDVQKKLRKRVATKLNVEKDW
jgi:Ca-activated chloride channel family protein